MRKRSRILIVALLLALSGLVYWGIWGEPWYHWKSLSGWLAEYGEGPRGYKPSPKADKALQQIGPKAVPYLLKLLDATNSPAVAKAIAAVGAGTYPTPASSTNWIVKIRFRAMGLVEKYTPIRFHHDAKPASWKHWQAYLGFQALGPSGKSAIPELAKLAHDPGGDSYYGNIQEMSRLDSMAELADNSSTYVTAGDTASLRPGRDGLRRSTKPFLVDGEIGAWSLAAIGADAVPALMELSADPNPRLKARAVQALGMVGPAAEPAVPALVRLLQAPELDVRIRAADALGCIGKQPELAVPALIEALNDSAMGVRYYAAQSLGMFRDRATNAIPELLANFADSDYRIKDSAAIALSKISRETTRTKVIPGLLLGRNNNMDVYTLGQMRDEPDLVIPALIEALDNTNAMIRGNAAYFLGTFGPLARKAVPKLVTFTNDQNPFMREKAARALSQIETGW